MRVLKVLCVALLWMSLACATGLCAAPPAVVSVCDAALLVRSGDQALLIGGEDEQAVESALSGGIQGVVRLCDHAEHSAAADALAAHYGVPVYAPGSALPVLGAAWQGETLVMEIDGTQYVFGADAERENAITYRCDGTVFPYSGQTNEAAVNLRRDTSTKSDKVGQLKRGELLYITGTVLNASGESWYRVQLADGTTGYIRGDLIEPALGETASAAIAQTPSGSPPDPSTGSGPEYIGNKKSKVFHLPTCHTLPAEKNQVYADSRDDFISQGYRPCKNCNP